MATGAYGPIYPIDVEFIRRGTAKGPEAASQDFKEGTPLVYSSGKLAAAGSAPSTIVGYSVNAASGTTDETVEFWPAVEGVEYSVVLDETYAVATHQHVAMGLVKDATTGYWHLDVDDTGDQMKVQRLLYPFVTGDAKGRVAATIASGKSAY